MKKLLNSRAFIAIITALAFGGLGYYMGSQSNQHEADQQMQLSETTSPADITLVDSADAGKWIYNAGLFAGELAHALASRSTENPSSLDTNNMIIGAGWTIPMDDIMTAMNSVQGKKYVRAYIGLKDYASNNFDPHLVITIVTKFNSCGCNGSGKDSIMPQYFDLVKPCPNLCDVNSTLYKKFLNGVNLSVKGYTPPCTSSTSVCK